MDKFRIRGGDFIGIIIPGIFLLTNLYLVFHDHIEIFLKDLLGSQKFAVQENVIIFIVFIVLSYTIGVVLRLLSPDIPDKPSGFMGICIEYFKQYTLQEYDKSKLSYHGKFPYFNWFMESARYNWPNIKNIFDEYLCYLDNDTRKRITEKDETLKKIASINASNVENNVDVNKENGKIEMNYRSFLNYCKLFVMHHSPALGDEILFAEGMSRMVSGLFYASLLSMIIIAPLILKHFFSSGYYPLLFILNTILVIIVTRGVRQLRKKEVVIVFASYGILLNTLIKVKNESGGEMINPPPHKIEM